MRLILQLMLVGVLTACGGGGGSAGGSGTSASGGSGSTTGAAAVPTTIVQQSAEPAQIYIKNSGAIEQAVLTFKVTSAKAEAVAGATVGFSIQDDNPYGLTLLATSATTDADGVVTVAVKSGGLPGPVKVRAQLASNSAVFAVSQGLSVGTSPPSQKFMSFTAATYAIEGWNIDGVTTDLTVRIADQQGNPVQDGTVVNFTTEGGQVGSSCATALVDGLSLCTVKFASQEFRPSTGRVTVLAYLEGINNFIDNNSNNVYDTGDALVDMGDAYRDDNEDGIYQAPEFLISRGGVGTCAGTGKPYPSRANTCDGGIRTTVRQQITVFLASSQAKIVTKSVATDNIVITVSSVAPIADLPMPSGTTITAKSADTSCKVDSVTPAQVPKTASEPTEHTLALTGCSGKSVVISVTSPNGTITTLTVPVP